MTKKKNIELTRSEALSLAWKKRRDYKGYDKSVGSKFNTWRAIVYSQKRKAVQFPDEWRDFSVFDKDTSDGWEKGKVLCRIDTSKPYSKENCEWRDKGQENMGKLIPLTYNGETKTILEWCALYNLNYNGVRQRYFRGKDFTVEQILFGKHKRLATTIVDINEISDEKKKRQKAIKMLSQYRLRDKKRGLDFDIDGEWFINAITHGQCHYCGDHERLGLDRIDNTKGHTMDNVVVCCYDCNVARGNNFTYSEMLVLGRTIRLIKEERKNEDK